MNLIFKPATIRDKEIIFNWLDKPYIQEFWDNSPEHKEDIIIFMSGRKEKYPYCNDEHDYHYWLGLIEDDPSCLIITSQIMPEEDIPQIWKDNLSKTGNSNTLDFLISYERTTLPIDTD
ncbi:hypothetical protein [Rickettsiales endosymbiont of Stachyamoeba lipophora]|uniref:hypothetical protein n=1 Tax=Rickettsiales endosymbiont of Stachyamoeba lipophora TaxID=2486578 RepID=UPI000F64D97B|nr:hypothetical protein [Rickettsiales endosymbiont of Stachyamoeba lipophora]AZL15939.1 hypothetical protein EF513_05220 [Rickettsiales endosymbiont of Stachyamoeba lipophora]